MRVFISVFLSLLSLCSVTFIWCLISSADVIGRLRLPDGILVEPACLGEPRVGLELKLVSARLGDIGDIFNAFSPSVLLILLVANMPTPIFSLGDMHSLPFSCG